MFAVKRKLFLDDSAFFRELFDITQRPDFDEDAFIIQGTNPGHPFHAEGVQKDDLVLFLRFLHPQ